MPAKPDELGPYRSRPECAAAFSDRAWPRGVVWLCGVLLPIGVLSLELAAGLCRDVLFDPLPSVAHVFLVLLVPVANLLALSWRATRLPWLQRLFNGAALVVTLIYSLIFSPRQSSRKVCFRWQGSASNARA